MLDSSVSVYVKVTTIVVGTILSLLAIFYIWNSMITFTTTILKFDKKGEKTGWTYIEINKRQAQQLKPDCKVSFRVMGTLDSHPIQKTAILPMGEGMFILPLNGAMRRAIGKKQGDKLNVILEVDERKLTLSHDLMICLKEDPDALKFFKSLPNSHQQYFSKWIESAKTAHTKTNRIVMAITAFTKKQGFPEMLRASRTNSF